MKKTAAMTIGVAAFALHLCAAPVVEITSVQQQYPWTNTVDITYTSTGIAEDYTYYVVFQALDSSGKEIGIITNDLKVSQGSTWVAQWQPPFNVRYENCSMIPYVYKGGMDDYMVIDLETWQVTYEPMSTQVASNEKYNTDEYKTKKFVLKKIDADDYQIGVTDYSYNTPHTVKVPAPYYIAIDSCTIAQYELAVNGTHSTDTERRNSISWYTIRGTSASISPASDGIMKLLNDKCTLSGSRMVPEKASFGFDLPTSSMLQIAIIYGGPSGAIKYLNPWEHTRDTFDSGNLANLQTDALVPVNSGTSSQMNLDYIAGNFNRRGGWAKNGSYADTGFRVAYFPQR